MNGNVFFNFSFFQFVNQAEYALQPRSVLGSKIFTIGNTGDVLERFFIELLLQVLWTSWCLNNVISLCANRNGVNFDAESLGQFGSGHRGEVTGIVHSVSEEHHHFTF